MLRRKSSKRLSRRKSTSSTFSKHEAMDPEVARQHAHTAATLAFIRAQERSDNDAGHRHPRSNTTSSNVERQSIPAQVSDSDGNIANTGVRRRQSVRFVGPNAVQRPQSNANRAAQAAIERRKSSLALGPMVMTTDTPVPAAYRPPSRSSSLGKASMGKGTAESFVTAAAAYNEYYTREDDVASTPSSYRRIRKSKSMFSPLKAPSVFYTNGTPDRSYVSTAENTPSYQASQSHPPIRVQRSMSFLRGGREHTKRERNDAAVQMARDRFFQQTAQQRLREQPSFLFRSKTQRQDRPFRKSVRSISTSNQSTPINHSDQFEPVKEYKFRVKARNASRTIKDALRKVFGRSKDSIDIPHQQVDAQETHVRKYCGDPEVKSETYENVPHPTQATLLSVASRPPSLHEVNSSQQLRSFAGSLKSTHSDHSDQKSRATSWDTSGVNTLTSQAARLQAERELQRLSIINEHGTHFPSSSFVRPKINQSSAYPFHHRHSKSAGHISVPTPGQVDSARVYSALMKRLDESSPRAKLEASRKESMESFVPSVNLRQRSSSLSSRGDRTPVTIRHVIPEDEIEPRIDGISSQDQWVGHKSNHSADAIFGFAGTNMDQWVPPNSLHRAQARQDDDVFSPVGITSDGQASKFGTQRHQIENFDTLQRTLLQSQAANNPRYSLLKEFELTPQEVAIRNEPIIQLQQPLRESRSTFFGGSSITIARSTSPFRRAQAEHENPSSNPAELRPVSRSIPNPIYVDTRHNEEIMGEVSHPEVHKAYSESTYSRTTSGQEPLAGISNLSLFIPNEKPTDLSPSITTPGDVVIIDRRTYRPAMPTETEHHLTGSAGSAEWKKWMSSEVSKLERAKENTNASASYVNYTLPTMPKSFPAGHVRENAQISDDTPDVSQRKTSGVKQPLGMLRQNPNLQNVPSYNPNNVPLLKPILKKSVYVSLPENGDSFALPETTCLIPPPPPIPPRSPIRQRRSRSSLGSENTGSIYLAEILPNSSVKSSSMSGRHVLNRRNSSATTLKSVKGSETPAKLVRKAKRSPCTMNPTSPGCGLSTAIDKHLSGASTRSRTPGSTWNIGPEINELEKGEDDIYDAAGAGLTGPVMIGGMNELDAQQMGSKRMVDMFLSSRRKRIAGGSDESGVFI